MENKIDMWTPKKGIFKAKLEKIAYDNAKKFLQKKDSNIRNKELILEAYKEGYKEGVISQEIIQKLQIINTKLTQDLDKWSIVYDMMMINSEMSIGSDVPKRAAEILEFSMKYLKF